MSNEFIAEKKQLQITDIVERVVEVGSASHDRLRR